MTCINTVLFSSPVVYLFIVARYLASPWRSHESANPNDGDVETKKVSLCSAMAARRRADGINQLGHHNVERFAAVTNQEDT
jgi:hypothetical protein